MKIQAQVEAGSIQINHNQTLVRNARSLRITTLTALLVVASAVSSLAQGNTAVGLWRLTFFDDSAPDMTELATQEICVLPGGTWQSTTFPGWGGAWFQKGVNPAGIGDHVRFVGNWGGNVGNDAGELDFVSVDLMTGTWSLWRDGLGYLGWRRNRLIRIARQCAAPQLSAEQAAAAARETRSPDGSKPKQ